MQLATRVFYCSMRLCAAVVVASAVVLLHECTVYGIGVTETTRSIGLEVEFGGGYGVFAVDPAHVGAVYAPVAYGDTMVESQHDSDVAGIPRIKLSVDGTGGRQSKFPDMNKCDVPRIMKPRTMRDLFGSHYVARRSADDVDVYPGAFGGIIEAEGGPIDTGHENRGNLRRHFEDLYRLGRRLTILAQRCSRGARTDRKRQREHGDSILLPSSDHPDGLVSLPKPTSTATLPLVPHGFTLKHLVENYNSYSGGVSETLKVPNTWMQSRGGDKTGMPDDADPQHEYVHSCAVAINAMPDTSVQLNLVVPLAKFGQQLFGTVSDISNLMAGVNDRRVGHISVISQQAQYLTKRAITKKKLFGAFSGLQYSQEAIGAVAYGLFVAIVQSFVQGGEPRGTISGDEGKNEWGILPKTAPGDYPRAFASRLLQDEFAAWILSISPDDFASKLYTTKSHNIIVAAVKDAYYEPVFLQYKLDTVTRDVVRGYIKGLHADFVPGRLDRYRGAETENKYVRITENSPHEPRISGITRTIPMRLKNTEHTMVLMEVRGGSGILDSAAAQIAFSGAKNGKAGSRTGTNPIFRLLDQHVLPVQEPVYNKCPTTHWFKKSRCGGYTKSFTWKGSTGQTGCMKPLSSAGESLKTAFKNGELNNVHQNVLGICAYKSRQNELYVMAVL